MADVLLVDDRKATAQMYEDWLTRLGHDVTVVNEPDLVTPESLAASPPQLAVIDLSYGNSELSGLDILLLLFRRCPTCRLSILTNGDAAVGDVLRISWEALPITVAISKGTLFDEFGDAIAAALDGDEWVDDDLSAWIPKRRDPGRSIERFAGLIGHAGHARLLQHLCAARTQPSQAEVARANGWVVATVRNYAEHLSQGLTILGYQKMTFAELHAFVQAARPIVSEAANEFLRSTEDP
ncbi:MAG: hypothetical protein ACRBI6_14055 [Acidimicrobiales bacterium]